MTRRNMRKNSKTSKRGGYKSYQLWTLDRINKFLTVCGERGLLQPGFIARKEEDGLKKLAEAANEAGYEVVTAYDFITANKRGGNTSLVTNPIYFGMKVLGLTRSELELPVSAGGRGLLSGKSTTGVGSMNLFGELRLELKWQIEKLAEAYKLRDVVSFMEVHADLFNLPGFEELKKRINEQKTVFFAPGAAQLQNGVAPGNAANQSKAVALYTGPPAESAKPPMPKYMLAPGIRFPGVPSSFVAPQRPATPTNIVPYNAAAANAALLASAAASSPAAAKALNAAVNANPAAAAALVRAVNASPAANAAALASAAASSPAAAKALNAAVNANPAAAAALVRAVNASPAALANGASASPNAAKALENAVNANPAAAAALAKAVNAALRPSSTNIVPYVAPGAMRPVNNTRKNGPAYTLAPGVVLPGPYGPERPLVSANQPRPHPTAIAPFRAPNYGSLLQSFKNGKGLRKTGLLA